MPSINRHMCAPCSDLPSNISTMVYIDNKEGHKNVQFLKCYIFRPFLTDMNNEKWI